MSEPKMTDLERAQKDIQSVIDGVQEIMRATHDSTTLEGICVEILRAAGRVQRYLTSGATESTPIFRG